MEAAVLKDVWKSVSMESGAPFVMNTGMILMLEWCALKWDIPEEVNVFSVLKQLCKLIVGSTLHAW